MTDVAVAVIGTDEDGRAFVAKVAPLRLTLTDGPGLLVAYGDQQVQIDGTAADGVAKLSTAGLTDEGGGGLSADGLHVDPRKLGNGWAYEVKAEGRRVVWAPGASSVPDWSNGADIVFAKSSATAGEGFTGRLQDAGAAGTSYLLRKPTLAKSPTRKERFGLFKRKWTAEARREALDAGHALPGVDGGSPRFPIEDQADVESAVKLARTAAERQHVMAQAKRLGASDAIPADWTARKSLMGPGMSTSAMVALYPSPGVADALALTGGYDPADLHVTLAFLGSDAVLTVDRAKVEAALAPLAATSSGIDGAIAGIGRFTPDVPPGTGETEWPLVAFPDLPGLPDFRQRLVATLAAAGIDVVQNHGFTPHITLAMVGPDDEWAAGQVLAAGIDPIPLHFDGFALAWGEDRTTFAFGVQKSIDGQLTSDETRELLRQAICEELGDGPDHYVWVRDFTDAKVVFDLNGSGWPDQGTFLAPYAIDDTGEVSFGDATKVQVRTSYIPDAGENSPVSLTVKAGPVIKSDEAKRYTFAPLYPALPENATKADIDAHGDVATADDIQAAVWDYMRAGDFRLRDQHTNAVAGEVVELACWPTEQTVELTVPGQAPVTKTFAPGTAFLGAVWTEKGWADVTKGRKRGYSLGGTAFRVDVEIGG